MGSPDRATRHQREERAHEEYRGDDRHHENADKASRGALCLERGQLEVIGDQAAYIARGLYETIDEPVGSFVDFG